LNGGDILPEKESGLRQYSNFKRHLPALLAAVMLPGLIGATSVGPALAQQGKGNPPLSPDVVALSSQVLASLRANEPAKATSLINHYRQSHRCAEDFYIGVADAYNNAFLNKSEHDYVALGLKQYPNSFALHLRDAQYWLRVNELELAEPQLRLCLKMQPRSAAARALLARLFNERLNFADGLKEIDAAIAQGPVDGSMLMTRANALNNLGRVEEAVADLDKAVAMSCGADLVYRKLRCQLLIRLGRPTLALEDALYLAKIDPGHADTFYDKAGACYLALKKPKEALKYYDLAIKRNQENMGMRRGRLAALEALKDTKAADQERKVVKQLEEDFTPNK
jgi:tetratricopeptide (TPR) repeat protein